MALKFCNIENRNKSYLLFLLLCTFIQFNIISCSKKSTIGTTDSPSTDLNDTIADEEPSSNYLWVHHKAVPGALRYTHKAVSSGSWPDQCKVDLDATSASDRDIMCITESTELDLMHIGMNLEYNVPAHVKCPYVITMAPYFFRFEPPRNDNDNDIAGELAHLEPANVSVIDNQVTGAWSASATYADGTTPNPYFYSGSGEYSCGFDYGSIKSGWPNCCEGKYNLKITTTTTDGTEIVNSVADWGGKRSNCLSGPALELNPTSDDGFPIPIIWRMKEQVDTMSSLKSNTDIPLSPVDLFKTLNKKLVVYETTKENFGNFEVGSLLDKRFGTTRYLANYVGSTNPRPFNDLLDYYYWEYPPGYNYFNNYLDPRYFTILCTDVAQEVTARIRVQIREWNTYSALKLATEPTSANEDDSSTAETDFPDFPNHDYYDWEDTSGLRRWSGTASSTLGYPGPSL